MKNELVLMVKNKTIDAVIIMKKLQEQYHAKGDNLYVFCRPWDGFDRVPRITLEWVMWKKLKPAVKFQLDQWRVCMREWRNLKLKWGQKKIYVVML